MFIFLDHFDRTRDSGFNSEIPSCACGILASSEHPSQQGLDLPSALLASDLNSGFLAQYGLDGPLDVYPDDGDEEEEEGAGDEGEAPEEELLGMPPAPSATSTTTKRKKREEMKQATIRQHYYPEGGWGFVVLTVAVLVQIISHGLQLSFGIFSLAIIRRWDESDTLAVGKKIILNSFFFHSPPVCSVSLTKDFLQMSSTDDGSFTEPVLNFNFLGELLTKYLYHDILIMIPPCRARVACHANKMFRLGNSHLKYWGGRSCA